MKTIKLTDCKDAFEANHIKNILENEGIECILTNETTSTLLPHLMMSPGSGVQIFVDTNDLEKAIKVLESNN